MIVADAARISMSIPFFFAAKRKANNDVFADGGILANYPIKIFDKEKYVTKNGERKDYCIKLNQLIEQSKNHVTHYTYNKETLGFKLDSYEDISIFHDHAEPKNHENGNFTSFVKRFAGTIFDTQSNNHLHSDDWHRTI